MPEGKKRLVGTLAVGHAQYWMHIDLEGNCWLTEPNGVLVRYNPKTDKLEKFPDALPLKASTPKEQMCWTEPLSGGRAAIATYGRSMKPKHYKLYIFNPAAEERRFELVADLGSIHVYSRTGMTLGGQDRFYYIQQRNEQLHLMSVHIHTKEVIDLGRVTDQEGRQPRRLPSIAADAEGRIFLSGSWHLKKGDTATTRLTNPTTGERIAPKQDRCERFAYVKLSGMRIK